MGWDYKIVPTGLRQKSQLELETHPPSFHAASTAVTDMPRKERLDSAYPFRRECHRSFLAIHAAIPNVAE